MGIWGFLNAKWRIKIPGWSVLYMRGACNDVSYTYEHLYDAFIVTVVFFILVVSKVWQSSIAQVDNHVPNDRWSLENTTPLGWLWRCLLLLLLYLNFVRAIWLHGRRWFIQRKSSLFTCNVHGWTQSRITSFNGSIIHDVALSCHSIGSLWT